MSDEKNPLPSVNIDLGIKAELKATIPEKSAGKLVDAIMDIIRPLSEWAGLRADLMRLRREDVLLEIAQKAQRRLALEREPPTPVALKFLVPYVENASNEEPGGSLIDWWAALLASAASGGSQHPVLADIMSKLTAAEASFLDKLRATGRPPRRLAAADVIERYSNGIRFNAVGENIGALEGKPYSQAIERICTEECNLAQRMGIFARFLQYPTDTFDGGSVRFSPEDDDLFDRCVSAGALERVRVTFPVLSPFISVAMVSIDCIVFSGGGLELMHAVHLKK